MKSKVLKILKNSRQEFVSGEKLSEELGVSRTSIWKYINKLREDGYEIESYPKRGYRLKEEADILSGDEIDPLLKTKAIGREIIYLPEVSSTNEELKRCSAEGREGLTIISEKQSLGKGRLGRTWTSLEKKGIYMSVLLKPNIQPQEAAKLTQIAAASVTLALREFGIDAKIKWPNDIILNGKKICGILTEMSGELMQLDHVILGIGINTHLDEEDLNEEIKEKASSIKLETGRDYERKMLLAGILNKFEELYYDFLDTKSISKSLAVCKENSIVLGREVRIIRKGMEEIKIALDLSEDGELIVKGADGKIEKIVSGEVSVRGLNGYI